MIDDLCDQHMDFRKHRHRYDRGKARAVFLHVAKQKKATPSQDKSCNTPPGRLSAAES
jgi:hypothetical protein